MIPSSSPPSKALIRFSSPSSQHLCIYNQSTSSSIQNIDLLSPCLNKSRFFPHRRYTNIKGGRLGMASGWGIFRVRHGIPFFWHFPGNGREEAIFRHSAASLLAQLHLGICGFPYFLFLQLCTFFFIESLSCGKASLRVGMMGREVSFRRL